MTTLVQDVVTNIQWVPTPHPDHSPQSRILLTLSWIIVTSDKSHLNIRLDEVICESICKIEMLWNIHTIKISATPLIMIKLSWGVNISINISLHLQYICMYWLQTPCAFWSFIVIEDLSNLCWMIIATKLFIITQWLCGVVLRLLGISDLRQTVS